MKKFRPGVLWTVFGIFLSAVAHANVTSYFIGSLESPNGETLVRNVRERMPLTTLAFKNFGSTMVSISRILVQTTDGKFTAVTYGNSGFGVQAGQTVFALFSNYRPQNVENIYFFVSGATGLLEVDGINESGPVPSGFSAGN